MNAEAIHPGALVDPRARLGGGVRVGAFSVIGPEVVLGDGVEVGHHVVLEGAVIVEPGARIGHGAVIGGVPQDLKYREGIPTGVRIGARTVIREHVTIHRATRPGTCTEVGPDCLIMAGSHIAHDCRLGRRVIVINYAGITGHCEIGDFATVGGLTGVGPFLRIGAYAYVGGCGKVRADVPPAMLADGLPATVYGVNIVGLRRAGVPAEERRAMQDVYRILYRSGLAPHRALDRLRREIPATGLVGLVIEFVAAARKGICGPSDSRRAGAQGPSDEREAEAEAVP
jgi:UDP-N-acetylglucosamine acyltransferase